MPGGHQRHANRGKTGGWRQRQEIRSSEIEEERRHDESADRAFDRLFRAEPRRQRVSPEQAAASNTAPSR